MAAALLRWNWSTSRGKKELLNTVVMFFILNKLMRIIHHNTMYVSSLTFLLDLTNVDENSHTLVASYFLSSIPTACRNLLNKQFLDHIAVVQMLYHVRVVIVDDVLVGLDNVDENSDLWVALNDS